MKLVCLDERVCVIMKCILHENGKKQDFLCTFYSKNSQCFCILALQIICSQRIMCELNFAFLLHFAYGHISHFAFYIKHFTYAINVNGLVSDVSVQRLIKMGVNRCVVFFEVMQEKLNGHVQCAKCATRNVFTCTT